MDNFSHRAEQSINASRHPTPERTAMRRLGGSRRRRQATSGVTAASAENLLTRAYTSSKVGSLQDLARCLTNGAPRAWVINDDTTLT